MITSLISCWAASVLIIVSLIFTLIKCAFRRKRSNVTKLGSTSTRPNSYISYEPAPKQEVTITPTVGHHSGDTKVSTFVDMKIKETCDEFNGRRNFGKLQSTQDRSKVPRLKNFRSYQPMFRQNNECEEKKKLKKPEMAAIKIIEQTDLKDINSNTELMTKTKIESEDEPSLQTFTYRSEKSEINDDKNDSQSELNQERNDSIRSMRKNGANISSTIETKIPPLDLTFSLKGTSETLVEFEPQLEDQEDKKSEQIQLDPFLEKCPKEKTIEEIPFECRVKRKLPSKIPRRTIREKRDTMELANSEEFDQTKSKYINYKLDESVSEIVRRFEFCSPRVNTDPIISYANPNISFNSFQRRVFNFSKNNTAESEI